MTEEVAEFGLETALEGLVNAAASAGEVVVDAAGTVAEAAVEIVVNVAGSALDGL